MNVAALGDERVIGRVVSDVRFGIRGFEALRPGLG